MYTLKAITILPLLALAFAAEHVPVTIVNLDPSFDTNCGSTTISGRDTYNAIAWALSLNDNDQTLTGTNGKSYPHYYANSEGFKWASPECTNADADSSQFRALMPIIKGGFFGEDNNNDPGKFRAVYYYDGSRDDEGHAQGYYCGTIYHASTDNSFSGCDVTTG